MELGVFSVTTPAAASGLNSYSRNRQEVNKVFWNGVNKDNLFGAPFDRLHQETVCKYVSEYLTLWFTVSMRQGDSGINAAEAAASARCLRCPHPCVSKGLW